MHATCHVKVAESVGEFEGLDHVVAVGVEGSRRLGCDVDGGDRYYVRRQAEHGTKRGYYLRQAEHGECASGAIGARSQHRVFTGRPQMDSEVTAGPPAPFSRRRINE